MGFQRPETGASGPRKVWPKCSGRLQFPARVRTVRAGRPSPAKSAARRGFPDHAPSPSSTIAPGNSSGDPKARAPPHLARSVASRRPAARPRLKAGFPPFQDGFAPSSKAFRSRLEARRRATANSRNKCPRRPALQFQVSKPPPALDTARHPANPCPADLFRAFPPAPGYSRSLQVHVSTNSDGQLMERGCGARGGHGSGTGDVRCRFRPHPAERTTVRTSRGALRSPPTPTTRGCHDGWLKGGAPMPAGDEPEGGGEAGYGQVRRAPRRSPLPEARSSGSKSRRGGRSDERRH